MMAAKDWVNLNIDALIDHQKSHGAGSHCKEERYLQQAVRDWAPLADAERRWEEAERQWNNPHPPGSPAWLD
jgi:hypothetical protein